MLESSAEVIAVREVLVDALVTDENGNVVPDLAVRDFRVRQNGKRVAVQSATFYSCLSPTPHGSETETASAPRPESRFFILLFQLPYANSAVLQEQVKRWLPTSLQPWDYVAVASYDKLLRIHQDFTRDHGAAAAAVGAWEANRQDQQAAGAPAAGSSSPSLAAGRGLGTLTALEALAEAADHVQRRKNLLLFGGAIESDDLALTRAARALNESDTAVYVLDAGASWSARKRLRRLAEATAGTLFTAFGSFEIPLGRILLENSGYYLLSFTPHTALPGTHQHVTIEVRRAGIRARGLPRQRPMD